MNKERLFLGGSLIAVAIGYAVVGLHEVRNGDPSDVFEGAILFGSSALMLATGGQVIGMEDLAEDAEVENITE